MFTCQAMMRNMRQTSFDMRSNQKHMIEIRCASIELERKRLLDVEMMDFGLQQKNCCLLHFNGG